MSKLRRSIEPNASERCLILLCLRTARCWTECRRFLTPDELVDTSQGSVEAYDCSAIEYLAAKLECTSLQ